MNKYFKNSLMKNPNNHVGLNSFGERLLFLRQRCAVNRTEFCKLANMSYNSLKVWESTKIEKIRPEGAQKALNTFKTLGVNCSLEWLLYGKGEFPSFVEVPSPSPDNLLTEEEKIYKELNYFKALHSNSVSLLITDTSMAPFYEPGDIVGGIKKTPEVEEESFIDRCCIVENNDGVKLIRNISLGNYKNTYNLSVLESNVLNFPTFYNVTISYAAPIIWHRRKK